MEQNAKTQATTRKRTWKDVVRLIILVLVMGLLLFTVAMAVYRKFGT